MSVIIFDFDDTLFETYKLKDYIFNKISTLGIPTRVITDTYERTVQNFNNYTIDNHISIINKMGEFKVPGDKIDDIKKIDFTLYKIKDTYDILKDLSRKHKLVLLTTGDKQFQKFKINNSGLATCFDEIYIVPGKKEKFLIDKNYTGNVYFINDKENENIIIRRMFPNFNVFDFDIKKEGGLKELSFLE